MSWKKTFTIIWSGQLVSILTSATVNYAVVFWLSLSTGSAQVLAYATIAAILPQAVLGFFTGVYVDRFKRKTVMIAADSFIAFCTLALALLLKTDHATMTLIYLLLALRSIGSAFHAPAFQSSIPLLAPQSELLRVAGINQVIESSSTIAGPALGALFISFMDIGNVLMLDIIGAIAGCTTLAFVKIPDPAKDGKRPDFIRELTDGIKYIISFKGLNFLFLFSILATFVIMPVSVMFPLMSIQHFGGGAFHISLIEILWGAGALAGGAVLGMKKWIINKAVMINCTYLVIGAAFAISGMLSPTAFVWFALLTAFAGVAGAGYTSGFNALMQEKIESSILGRIFSIRLSLELLPAVIALAGTGFLAETVGILNTFIVMGSFMIMIGVVSFFFPSVIAVDKKRVQSDEL